MEGKELKIKDGIIGLIVGDSLGVPVEFTDRSQLDANPVRNMREYGIHWQPKGTWSDDSSLTLCLIDALLDGYSIERLAEKFVKWHRDGYLTPYGEVFDVGITTSGAITKLRVGCAKPWESGMNDEYSNGNGSLMRILPLAYVLCDKSIRERRGMIEEVSSITHRHRRSVLACEIYIEFVINLLSGMGKLRAYEKTRSDIMAEYSLDKELEHYNRVIMEDISVYDRREIQSSGYVVSTLEASLWCFMNRDNYKDAVLEAVNLGDDTDTVASIAGGMAGIYYGIKSIPSEWVEQIAKIEEIKSMLDRFEASVGRIKNSVR